VQLALRESAGFLAVGAVFESEQVADLIETEA
jgi:hypothetical protein